MNRSLSVSVVWINARSARHLMHEVHPEVMKPLENSSLWGTGLHQQRIIADGLFVKVKFGGILYKYKQIIDVVHVRSSWCLCDGVKREAVVVEASGGKW